MGYRIGIITVGCDIAKEYKKQIEFLFKDLVAVSTYSIEDNTAFNLKGEDLFLITAIQSDLFGKVMENVDKSNKIVMASLAFTREAISTLKQLECYKTALLVNVTYKMAMETITMLHQSGINHIEFEPYYPGCKTIPPHEFIVTPHEVPLAPKTDKPLIDIGNRVFDANTITDIAVKLNCEYVLEYKHIKRYFEKLSCDSFAISNLMHQNFVLSHELSILLHASNKPIAFVDNKGDIKRCNENFCSMVGMNSHLIENENINNLIKKVPLDIIFENKITAHIIVTHNKYDYKCTAYPIFSENDSYAVIILEKTNDFDKKRFKDNELLIQKGHIAKYKFSDITGESDKMVEAKRVAKTMAKSDSPVLIFGESGTGKELFAHAIHNASQRATFPFVAINCAAIPDNLLESELFGYEEGSFTGAKKGGKKGLFEIADSGTLFLDEIEEMSKALQVKLLRVIQEGQVMRVGGDEIIDVNVRIITATNEKLNELIENGQFRRDLYYRICTLPISVPPLRERGEDIFLLVDRFKVKNLCKFILTSEVQQFFLNYPWHGNVRELQNCIEYLSCIGEEIIDIKNLPEFMKEQAKLPQALKIDNDLSDLEYKVLCTVKGLCTQNKFSGRSTIFNILIQEGEPISLAKVRTCLNSLVKKGYISTSQGPSGNTLTEKAIEILK